ncbi:MAG: hypothetical protein AVDCRST_MAG41-4574, partial [uncultured Corynebacteriales bacterium]
MSLGPLRADAAGSRLETVAGYGCRFRRTGVELESPADGVAVLLWPDVRSIRVEAPVRHRWVRAAPEIGLSLLSFELGGVRSRDLLVRITGPRGDRPLLDLGPVGPYGWRAAVAVEALFQALSERAALPALGDPAAAAALVAAATGVRRRGVGAAVDAVL